MLSGDESGAIVSTRSRKGRSWASILSLIGGQLGDTLVEGVVVELREVTVVVEVVMLSRHNDELLQRRMFVVYSCVDESSMLWWLVKNKTPRRCLCV